MNKTALQHIIFIIILLSWHFIDTWGDIIQETTYTYFVIIIHCEVSKLYAKIFSYFFNYKTLFYLFFFLKISFKCVHHCAGVAPTYMYVHKWKFFGWNLTVHTFLYNLLQKYVMKFMLLNKEKIIKHK